MSATRTEPIVRERDSPRDFVCQLDANVEFVPHVLAQKLAEWKKVAEEVERKRKLVRWARPAAQGRS